VERYKDLKDEDQELFKKQLTGFRNLYAFLSQVIPYQDSDLERQYTYLRFLLSKLPKRQGEQYKLDGEVALKYYRLEKISEGSITLEEGEADPLQGPTEVGSGTAKDERVILSMLVDKLNERFGTDFTKADELFFDQVVETATANEKLQEAARANTLENFSYVFDKMLETLFIDRMEGNEEIFTKLMNDDNFRQLAATHLVKRVYQDINKG